MRNVDAEVFSVACIRTYGGELFEAWEHNERTSCTMHSSFSRLRPHVWPVSIESISSTQLEKYLHHFLTVDLIPAIRHVTTANDFLSLLMTDEPILPWAGTNGAIRAAQIVVLGNKTHLNEAELRHALERRKSWIANGLSKTSEMRRDPMLYINKVIEEWQLRSRGQDKSS